MVISRYEICWQNTQGMSIIGKHMREGTTSFLICIFLLTSVAPINLASAPSDSAIWGVTYDVMNDGGCMWKCKYLGFNFVLDLWTFYNKGEFIMLLEIRNIDCDDGTFKDLRNHIFQHID